MTQIIGFVAMTPEGIYLPMFTDQEGKIFYLDLSDGFYPMESSNFMPVFLEQVRENNK